MRVLFLATFFIVFKIFKGDRGILCFLLLGMLKFIWNSVRRCFCQKFFVLRLLFDIFVLHKNLLYTLLFSIAIPLLFLGNTHLYRYTLTLDLRSLGEFT